MNVENFVVDIEKFASGKTSQQHPCWHTVVFNWCASLEVFIIMVS